MLQNGQSSGKVVVPLVWIILVQLYCRVQTVCDLFTQALPLFSNPLLKQISASLFTFLTFFELYWTIRHELWCSKCGYIRTEQEHESDQLGDDFLPKNAYDPHAKWKKRSEIWDYFIQASISNDLFWLRDSMGDCVLIFVRFVVKFTPASNLINLFNMW